jgi:hypothetical protein
MLLYEREAVHGGEGRPEPSSSLRQQAAGDEEGAVV